MKPTQLFLVLLLVLGSILLVNSLFVVKESQQVMVLQLGKIKSIESEPGLKMKTPFIQQIMVFDKRILETDSGAEQFQTKAKEPLNIDSFTRWRIVDAKKFYETVRTISGGRSRLDLIVNSNLRRVLAQHMPQEIVSGDRDALLKEVIEASGVQAAELGVEVVDVRIKRTDWPEQISLKVFGRMRTEREKEAKAIRAEGAESAQKIRAEAEKKRTILLAEAQRDAQKLRGDGDAEAIKVTAAAYNKSPDFFGFIRSLEAYKKSLAGNDSLLVLDPSMDFFKHFGAK